MPAAADYIENVRKYDSGATEAVVQKVVNYCGIALRSKDASLVGCSDETEKNRIRDDRMKSRVTFYYLLAKNAGKLSIFGG